MSHGPQKLIFNYSSHALTASEKSLLCKELNFDISPDKLKYFDFSFPFKIQNLNATGLKKQLLHHLIYIIKKCTIEFNQ